MEPGAPANPTPSEPLPLNAGDGDVTRRTWLAAERTWLAWWRTGLAASAVALAVGRLLPSVSHGEHWESQALGIGYALLALGVFVMGAVRQRANATALRSGSFDELSPRSVLVFTAVSVVLAVATLAIIGAAL